MDARSRHARDLVTGPVRQAVRDATPTGTSAHVGGTAAVFVDVATAVDRDLRTVFPVAAALIALFLVVLVLSVGLCFAATFGDSALVFQHIGGEPGVNFVLPLVLFLFVVALGTDYNILVSDRLREEMTHGGPVRDAVARAVRHTAPAVATAGVVLAASFGSLAVNADASTRQLGFATTLGILLSSFVLSLLLVPAAAALLGRGRDRLRTIRGSSTAPDGRGCPCWCPPTSVKTTPTSVERLIRVTGARSSGVLPYLSVGHSKRVRNTTAPPWTPEGPGDPAEGAGPSAPTWPFLCRVDVGAGAAGSLPVAVVATGEGMCHDPPAAAQSAGVFPVCPCGSRSGRLNADLRPRARSDPPRGQRPRRPRGPSRPHMGRPRSWGSSRRSRRTSSADTPGLPPARTPPTRAPSATA
ncbi:MMPL family transporter [Streptomyces cinereoruber]|uniref:MMPL family transporter n=1 Tax=Streptomyces cinereoruber TaxID=67260 RepID=UPI00363E51BA